MSLATRCTACGTIFRVVQDQLRVSEGWVRCGRCAEIFDAQAQLFDLDREAPPPWPPLPAARTEPLAPTARTADAPTSSAPSVSQAPHTHVAPHAHPAASAVTAPAWADDEDDAQAYAREVHARADLPPWETPSPAHPAHPAHEDFDPEPVPESDAIEWSASRFLHDRREPLWEEAAPPAPPPPEPDLRPEPKGLKFAPPEPVEAPAPLPPIYAEPTTAMSALSAQERVEPGFEPTQLHVPEPTETPGFLRRAQGQDRWSRPVWRWSLGLGTALLTLSAAAQWVWHHRDEWASRSPVMQQALSTVCSTLGCEIRPWHKLDAFVVESTALTEAASGNHYQLTVTLQNKSAWTLATPWVLLSLKDGSERVLMRRALKPEEFQQGRVSVGPRGELQLQLVFSTGAQKVQGYVVDLFYP